MNYCETIITKGPKKNTVCGKAIVSLHFCKFHLTEHFKKPEIIFEMYERTPVINGLIASSELGELAVNI